MTPRSRRLLGGGLAAWARGGPPTEHDVDFYVREADAEAALAALVDGGLHEERPPEGWLLKAWDGEVLVDLIFHPSGGPIGDEHFARAEQLEVMAQPLLVASLDDVMSTKLLSISEQEPRLHERARAGAVAAGADRLGDRPRADGRVARSRRRSSRSSRSWGSSSARRPRSRTASRPPTTWAG